MLARFFFRETRFLAMIVMTIVIGGLAAFWTLGRQEDPLITNRYAAITTSLPGADPAVVEALISTVIEDQIKTIANIDTYSSSSLRGVSVVRLSARDSLSKGGIEKLWADVAVAVDRARLSFPEDAGAPRIDTQGITSYTTVIAVEMHDPDISPLVAARFATTIERRLRNIDQTRHVRLFGTPEAEVAVILDPFEASMANISVEQVAGAIRSSSDLALAGRFVTDGLDTDLVMSQPPANASEIRDVQITIGADGASLRVGDVAEVRHRVRAPPDMVARSNGTPAVLIAAVIEDGAQVDRWMRFVREDVAEIARQVPEGLTINILFDQSTYTVERLQDLGQNLLFGMVLVLLVLFLTLGARAAAIVGLVLPLVCLATLASFMYLDLPLHQMSIIGLIVALGLVVDAAIVTTDTVRRRLNSGNARDQAAEFAVGRLFVPLAASTITTFLTFLPMILLPGNVGDFVRTISIAVSVMLFWSFFLAMILTATMAARLLPASKGKTPEPPVGDTRMFRALRLILDWPRTSLLLSMLLPALGFLMASQMPSQFFPLAERNQFYISVELPAHSNVARTDMLVQSLDRYLADIDGITDRYWVAGGSAPAFYYNIVGGSTTDPSFAQGMITTESAARARQILTTLQADMTANFPEARATVSALAQGPPVGAPVSFYIYGSDIAELRRIGAEMQQAIAPIPEVAQLSGGLADGQPQLRFIVDKTAAGLVGLDEGAIAAQLRNGLSGTVADFLMDGTERLPIRVQFRETFQGNVEAISDFPILVAGTDAASGRGLVMPLSSLAQPTLAITETLIYRYNGERMNYVQVYPHPEVLPSTVFAKAQAAIHAAGIALPDGYRIEAAGEETERNATVDGLMASVALIALLGITTLIVTFGSFRLTMGTMIVAALSAGLSLLSVAALGYPLGINALIGVIGSVGVSVNASIIIFTALQNNANAASGDLDAATREVLDGARHIISTTLTTFGGFLPLLFQGGLFWPPFAAAIAGGVLLSGSLAFLFAPAYFRLVYAKSHAVPATRPVAQPPESFAPERPPCAAQYTLGIDRRFEGRKKHPLRAKARTTRAQNRRDADIFAT
ncbi:MAG: efflux RND transporter permease subunit [Rhodobacteraceae bacterium]|nr:efflux RND transporter permease subunit [Paracoccaceae bacterium]